MVLTTTVDVRRLGPMRGTPATEARKPTAADLDLLSTAELVARMNAEDSVVPAAVGAAGAQIAEVVDEVADRLRRGGRLVYAGAGTSGGLAELDASETALAMPEGSRARITAERSWTVRPPQTSLAIPTARWTASSSPPVIQSFCTGLSWRNLRPCTPISSSWRKILIDYSSPSRSWAIICADKRNGWNVWGCQPKSASATASSSIKYSQKHSKVITI